MFDLLKVDLKRTFKDKLLLIIAIISLVIALINPLLYKGIFSVIDIDVSNSKTSLVIGLFSSSFSPSQNIGLIIPIFVAIIINKDFSYGTIRNKIICGKKREQVFLSTFVTSAIITCGLVLIQAIITFLFSFMIFGGASFSGGDIGYIFQTVLYGILLYVFISALVAFLAVWAKNVGLIIICYLAISLIFSIAGNIIVPVTAFLGKDKQLLKEVLTFFNNVNLFYQDTSALMGAVMDMGTPEPLKYTLSQILYKTITPIIFTTAYVLGGVWVFNKKDIK